MPSSNINSTKSSAKDTVPYTNTYQLQSSRSFGDMILQHKTILFLYIHFDGQEYLPTNLTLQKLQFFIQAIRMVKGDIISLVKLSTTSPVSQTPEKN